TAAIVCTAAAGVSGSPPSRYRQPDTRNAGSRTARTSAARPARTPRLSGSTRALFPFMAHPPSKDRDDAQENDRNDQQKSDEGQQKAQDAPRFGPGEGDEPGGDEHQGDGDERRPHFVHAAHGGPITSDSRQHPSRSEEHTSELQSRENLVCR